MNVHPLQAAVEYRAYRRHVSIWLYRQLENGDVAVSTGIEFTNQDEGRYFPPAPIELPEKEAQDLMDQLYQAGIRPSAAAGTAGQLDAIQKHLGDMRALTAAVLKVELPK